MRKLKKALSLSLALALSLTMAVPSFAATVESIFIDEGSREEARLELDRDPLGVWLPWDANFDYTTDDSIPLPNIYVPVGTKVRSFEIRSSSSESYSSGLVEEGETVYYYGPDGTEEALDAAHSPADGFALAREGQYDFGFAVYCGPSAILFAVTPGDPYNTTLLAQPNGLEAKLSVYNITAQSTVSYQGKQIPLYNVIPGTDEDNANLWIHPTAGASCVVNSYDTKIENGVLTAVEKDNNWEFTGGEDGYDYFWYGLDEGDVNLVEYIENGVILQTFALSTGNGSAPAQPEQPTTPTTPEQPTTPPVEPARPDAPGTYTVKKGDTWSSICINFYGNNSQRGALQKANKGVALKEGAVITLPEKLGKDTLIPAPAAGAGEKLYTVRAGDTLGRIAAAEYGKASEYKAIFERNADRLKNANTIYEGQVIVLPAKK